MAISARCQCGKRTSVADALAGKVVTCGACGRDVQMPTISGGPERKTAAQLKVDRQNAAAGSAVSFNPNLVRAAIVGAVVLVVVLVFYFGPWTVERRWDAMSAHANTVVTDVVDFSIKAYESEHSMYDTSQSHDMPHIDGDATFVPPMMAFTMPQHIIFSGKTNRGNYMGTYDTTTGEVSADVEIGGMTVGGLVNVRNATGKFHVVGHDAGGTVDATCDGKPLQIVVRKHNRDDD